MKNFKELWAKKAQAKNISAADMFEYCIIKAIAAKNEDKEKLANIFIAKAFLPGPVQLYPHRAVREARNYVLNCLRHRRENLFMFNILETPEEIAAFYTLAQELEGVIS